KLAAGIGYMASPIDLIPGVIPVLGQLDDILAILIVLNNVLSSSPREVIEPYLDETGLSYELVDADVATTKRVLKDLSITLAKKTGRGLLKIGRYIGRGIAGGPKSSGR
ncbi:MAG TPA: YkvA family protein, partial [Anaerolineae bacterium]|nr:YkvA family protein [Anaerolineae bacterium]